MNKRVLVWDGCKNVRDLGGLRTVDNRKTLMGVVVRSDSPARLTPMGWSALYDYGIRTIITLGTDGMVEDELDFSSPYPDLSKVHVAIEDVTDTEFVQKWANTNYWGTPLYYQDALQRWPERHAVVISALARAQPGGVLYHCVRGYDRTGIISMLLLALVGVQLGDIASDYELSVDPFRDELLASEHTSVQEEMFKALEGLDIDSYLQEGGVSQFELAVVRKRLLG